MLKAQAFVILFAVLAMVWPACGREPPQFLELRPGLSYAHIQDTDGPLSIHVLRINRQHDEWQWTTALGEGRVYGLGPLTRMVRATSRRVGAPAVAAINGDWFQMAPGNYQGDPRGLQIVEGQVVSAPTPHTCVWINADGSLSMGIVESRFRVVWTDGKTETPFGLNEPRPDDAVVLFTAALGHHESDSVESQQSTRTVDGREVQLQAANAGEADWPDLRIGRTYQARVAKVRETGNSRLSGDSVVLSVGPTLARQLPKAEVGDTLTIRLRTDPDLTGTRTAIGGGLRLVRQGVAVAFEDVAATRHPRSMLGWNTDDVFLVVVDGRQPELSIGMTYQELAALAVELGLQEAMALDGGGSSTLWADGRLLNSSSDGEPRSVANALILLERQVE